MSNFIAGGGSPFANKLLHVRDVKATNTDGGTFTSGAFRTRVLNTVLTNEITGASLASNQITLPSGDFIIIARCPAFVVDRHQSKLRNITDSTDTLIGTSQQANAGNIVDNMSTIFGKFTLSASKTLEVQHRCQTTKATDGFGSRANVGLSEIYTDVMIWKV